MIRKFLSQVFPSTFAARSSSITKKMIRRLGIEPLETRHLLAVTGSLSGFAYLDTHDFGVKDADEAGFAGLTVQLQGVSSQGQLSDVAGVGPLQTLSNGSYSFNGLSAGTYQIQILPSANVSVGTLTPGLAGGTAGADEIQVTLAAGQNATDYNFAILGSEAGDMSLRMFMASSSTSISASSQSSSATTARRQRHSGRQRRQQQHQRGDALAMTMATLDNAPRRSRPPAVIPSRPTRPRSTPASPPRRASPSSTA